MTPKHCQRHDLPLRKEYGSRSRDGEIIYGAWWRCPLCEPTNDEIASRLEAIERKLGIL